MIEIPAMDYDRDPVASPGELARQIREGLRGCGYSADDTILHVHNHSLGKNLSLQSAIRILACDGFRLLLQIHDFAEDYRHEHYARMTAALATMATDGTDDLASVLYPQAEHIDYATLNRRDWSILRDAGVPWPVCTCCRTPCPSWGLSPREPTPASDWHRRPACPWIVRLCCTPCVASGVRTWGWRSLVGVEPGTALQLYLAADPSCRTDESPPVKAAAGELRLPCHFELGTLPGLTLTDLLAAADLILTTSVAEGFGMVFLESWLAGRPLVGRDLPEISADFVAAGMRLNGLRPRLSVPLEWVNRRTFSETLTSLYASCLQSFGHSAADSATVAAQVKELVSDGTVDFAMLDPRCKAA